MSGDSVLYIGHVHSGFRPLVIIHFNTKCSTLHYSFRRIGIRPRDWPSGFGFSTPAKAQISLSAAKLFLSSSAIGCLRALWHSAVLQHLMRFVLPISDSILLSQTFFSLRGFQVSVGACFIAGIFISLRKQSAFRNEFAIQHA